MIDDWYFCSAMRDTAQATHSYLAVLDVLDAPGGLPGMLPDALTMLGRCERWTALHVAPRLLRLAGAGGDSADRCLDQLLETLRDTVEGGAVARPLGALLRACAREDPSGAVAALRHAVTAWNEHAAPRPTTEPFRELTRYAQESLLLAATAHLAARPETADDLRTELRGDGSVLEDLTRRALRQEYGRLPFLLALRARGEVAPGAAEREELLRMVCDPGIGHVHLEPDLMAAAARLLHPGGRDGTAGRVAGLDRDAVTLDGLRRLCRTWDERASGVPERRVLDRLGIAAETAPQALSPVLWQQTLWDMAAATDPAAAAALLVKRWAAPGGRPEYPVRFLGPVEQREVRRWGDQLTALWQLRTGSRPVVTDGTEAVPVQLVRTARSDELRTFWPSVWAFSPWVDRVRTGWAPTKAPGDTFPTASDPVVLLRLLSAVRTAVRLMRHGGEAAHPLADLVLHGTEVLSEGARGHHITGVTHGTEQAPDSPLPPVLVPLAYAAHRTGMYALRGVYPELHPEVFARRAVTVARGGPNQRVYRQAKLLHDSGGALHVLVQAVLDALSGYGGPQDDAPQSRWFHGEPPLAEPVLRQAAHGLDTRLHRREVGNANLLLRLVLEQDVSGRRLAETRDTTGTPTFQELLLVQPGELDSPREVTRFAAWVRKSHRVPEPLSWASARLLHALSKTRDGSADSAVPELVDAWIQVIDQVGATKELPRLGRWFMLQLLDVVRVDGEHESRLLDKFLDVFTEFGLSTPMDLRLLFHRLVHAELPEQTATRLRARLLSLSYDGRLVGLHGLRTARDAWDLEMLRTTELSLERQLNWLVRKLTRDDSPEAGSNRAFVEYSWQASVLTSALRSTPLPLDGSAHPASAAAAQQPPDPRSVMAVFSYETSHQAVFHWLPVEPEAHGAVDLFREPHRRKDVVEQAGRRTFPSLAAVVCGSTDGGRRLLVNCGLGEPLEAPPCAGAGLGDPVVVVLEPDRDRESLPVGVKETRRMPVGFLPGDVRRVQVAPNADKGVADVTPDGLPPGGEPHSGPLAEWDPDLSQPFAGSAPLLTVGRYEKDGWHPVDRGFTELLATRLPYDNGTVAVLTLLERTSTRAGTAWRFGLEPGRTFLLPERFWDPVAAERLRAEAAEWEEPAGLRCWVRLTDDEHDGPSLTLTDPPADVPPQEWPGAATDGIDRRNPRWRELCASGTVDAVRKGTRWYVEHDIPGFPPVVVEDMPPLVQDTAQQAITGWDERALRTARVSAEASRHAGDEEPGLEEFLRLYDLPRNAVVRLGAGMNPRHGTLRAWTKQGNVEVAVEAQSVMLRPGKETDRWTAAVRNRSALITGVSVRNTPRGTAKKPVPDAELLSHVAQHERAGIAQRLARMDYTTAILRSAPADGSGHAPRVWLRVGDRIIDLHVPWSAFTAPTQRSGDQVLAFRSAQGWSFTARGRRVFARCLWRLEQRESNAALGVLEGAGETPLNVAHDPRREDVLLAWAGRTKPADARAPHGRVVLGPPYVDPADRAQRHRVEVRLPGGRSMWGVTDTWYPSETAWQVDGVALHAEPVDQGGRTSWDVRRVFSLAPAAATDEGADHAEAWPVVTRESGWSAALRDGHAVLAPVGLDGGRRTVSLPPVPLVAGEGPHVEGGRYRPERAHVVLLPAPADAPGGLPYVASYRRTPPVDLRAFKNLQNIVEGRETATSLYFVGAVSARPGQARADWLLFEWGFGRTLRVHRGDVTLDGRPLRWGKELPVFHGDRVTLITLTARTAQRDGGKHGGLSLDLHGSGIRWSDERFLRDQAHQHVLPRLTVRLDRMARTADVLSAEGRGGSIGADESPNEVRSARLRLHQDDVDVLLKQYPSGPEEVRVLGFLDTDAWDGSGGREVTFRYVRPTLHRRDPNAIRPGQHVFMWADRILRHPNDITLDLFLELGPKSAPQRITARVTRRAFAHREDLLRRILEEDGSGALEETCYLVELTGQRKAGQFEGRLSHAPTRPARALRGHLTPRNPSCFAVVTAVAPRVRLELRAGVFVVLGTADLADSDHLDVGAVVRVTRADQGRFRLRTALPGDAAYGLDGREVVVFPKNQLLTGHTPDKLDRTQFTVSGLPNVQLLAQPSADDGEDPLAGIRELMRYPHPKIGRIRREDTRSFAVPLEPEESSARWLSIDLDTLEPTVRPVASEEGTAGTPVPTGRLSFADLGMRALGERHAAARHVPHDLQTGHWPDGLPESVEIVQFDGREGIAEPVMTAGDAVLRYPPGDLRRFAFPANLLIDRRRRGRAALGARETGDRYAVAGPAMSSGRASGLWLELSPGRLVEVPGELAHAMTAGTLHPLDGLCWALFRPGDEVSVSAYHRTISEPAFVVLHDWRPGLRGALGEVPAVLTVLAVEPESGTLRLGGADASLEYPVTRAGAREYAPGDTVRLTPGGNDLVRCADGVPARPGDAVLLSAADDGTLYVHGMPGRPVVPAEEGWADDAWLRRELQAGPEAAHAVLSAVGGALPVTVESLESDGGLRVSRAAQPRLPGDAPWETLARVTGRLADGRLLLRCGGALLPARAGDLVPGLPEGAADAVAAVLMAEAPDDAMGGALWLRRTESGGLCTGLPVPQRSERQVLPLAAVHGDGTGAEGAGLLCREEDSRALRWMPAEHAAWARLTGRQLDEALVVPEVPLRVAVLGDGRVSAAASPSALGHFGRLGIGDPVRLVVLGGAAPMEPHGRRRYLARLESSDMLVTFSSEASNHGDGERLVAEVDRLTRGPRGTALVRTVPRGKRDTIPDLPSVVTQGRAVRETVRRRFADYRELCADPELEITEGRAADPVDVRVVRAAWEHVAAGNAGQPSPEASEALEQWLGSRASDEGRAGEVDLVPLLGATLLAAGTPDPEHERIAVGLARQAGERALRAVHVDPMLDTWLSGRGPRQGVWGRLTRLSLRPLLNPRHLAELVTFGRGRLYRAAVEREPELHLIALGLLASVGEPVALDPLFVAPGPLTGLAALSRALVPPRDRRDAQDRLHPGQIAFLASAFDAAVRAASPAVLPAPLTYPSAGSSTA
ncbi:hypothetical protein [Streptomyces sp. NPDC001381]|uniref:hypothetical protein n=1 Tax=Streptomyces sp. NPDC001381 TaxID=3364567 RepID=UPI0036901104